MHVTNVCLITISYHVPDVLVISRLSDSVNSASSVITITMGENHEERLRPRAFSRSQFSLREGCFIRFNISLPSDALIGVYGSRNAHPSHVQYDFFFVFNGVELLSQRQQQPQLKKRDAANEQTVVGSEIYSLGLCEDFCWNL